MLLSIYRCSCELCRVCSCRNTFRKWTQCNVHVNGKLSKTKAHTLQRRRWRVLGKISNIFLPHDRNEADISGRISLFYKDEDRRQHLESGQVKNEWGRKSPLDVTTYRGLKENGQVIHCWIFVYKRDGIIIPYSDKRYDAGSAKNSLHSLDGKLFFLYLSFRVSQVYNIRGLEL